MWGTRPAAAGHFDAFDTEFDAFVEHVSEGQVAHHVGANGEFHRLDLSL
jgi:hypothetical protein